MTYTYQSYTNRTNNQIKTRQQKDNPLDTISAIVWDTNNLNEPAFFASSWDGYIRLYIVKNQLEKAWEIFCQHPVLCFDVGENGIIYAGLASGDIIAIELGTGNIMCLGAHEAPICGVFWVRQKGCLMTLGCDNLIRFWILDEPSRALQKQYKLPLKTATCSLDFPLLLIGSIETSIVIINLKNLPDLFIPESYNYSRVNLQKFSKLNCSKINSSVSTASLGTVDGKCLIFKFKLVNNGFEATDPFVSRVQKKLERNTTFHGQVDAVDIGCYSYQPFVAIGGSQDLSVYNVSRKSKSKTIITCSSTNGATTAVKFSPKADYVAYATGSDWLKGLNELQTMKRPRIFAMKLNQTDLNDFTIR